MSVLYLLAVVIVLRTTFNQPNQLLISFSSGCLYLTQDQLRGKLLSSQSYLAHFSFLMTENRWCHYTFAKSPYSPFSHQDFLLKLARREQQLEDHNSLISSSPKPFLSIPLQPNVPMVTPQFVQNLAHKPSTSESLIENWFKMWIPHAPHPNDSDSVGLRWNPIIFNLIKPLCDSYASELLTTLRGTQLQTGVYHSGRQLREPSFEVLCFPCKIGEFIFFPDPHPISTLLYIHQYPNQSKTFLTSPYPVDQSYFESLGYLMHMFIMVLIIHGNNCFCLLKSQCSLGFCCLSSSFLTLHIPWAISSVPMDSTITP